MSIVETIKEFLTPQPPRVVITYRSAVDYENLPQGFFNVVAGEQKSLGYRFADGGFNWRVGETVVDGGKRVTLAVPRSELTTVNLNFTRPSQAGAQHVGGSTVIETDTESEAVTYDGVNAPREWL